LIGLYIQLIHIAALLLAQAEITIFGNLFSAGCVIGVIPGDRSFQGRGENQTPGITLRVMR
jgi:hypothetical protein